MKKLICMVLAIVWALTLMACGTEEDVAIVEEKVFEFDEENQCKVSVFENKKLLVKFEFDGENLDRDKLAFRWIYATMRTEEIDGNISISSGDIQVTMQILNGNSEVIFGKLGEMDWPGPGEGIDDLSEAEEKYGDTIWNIDEFICGCAK